jgi:hypothetical protein
MKLKIGLFALLAIFQLSCGKDSKCFKSQGDIISKFRPLGVFHTIRVNGKFDVELQMDSSKPRGITLEGGENLIPYVKSDVFAEVLTIEDNNSCNWVRDYDHRFKIVINSYHLIEIELNGACEFTSSDTIKMDSLVLEHNSTRDVTLILDVNKFLPKQVNSGWLRTYGRCGIYTGIVEEIGSMDSRGLKTNDMYLFYFCPADGYTDADQILSVKMFGLGNVFYVKEPNVKLEYLKRGKGKLEKL